MYEGMPFCCWNVLLVLQRTREEEMQGGRDPFFGFGDPFGSSGSGFSGGRDPFDDPFFTRPSGSMFESSFFGSAGGHSMNPHASATGFLEHQPPQRTTGLIIEELNSDYEKEGEKEIQDNPRKHERANQKPFTEKKSRRMSERNGTNLLQHMRSQAQSHTFNFQSSTVSYGGTNGAYYTSSRTRRSGSDGLTFEECKEADSTTRQATHRVSRGIHDKGHSITRKLKSDGHVDTMQTLHNLNEDELLTGFDKTWKRSAKRHFPGWSEQFSLQDGIGSGNGGQQRANSNRGGWALPSSNPPLHSSRIKTEQSSRIKTEHSSRTKPEHSSSTKTEHSSRIKTEHSSRIKTEGSSLSCHRSKGSGSSNRR